MQRGRHRGGPEEADSGADGHQVGQDRPQEVVHHLQGRSVLYSGHPNIISVWFWTNILADISISFGILAFVSFGIRQKHTFLPKEAVSAKIDLV